MTLPPATAITTSTLTLPPYNRTMSQPKRSGKKKEAAADRDIAQNRRARFEYFIEDSFEAGIVLLGWEVKSLRVGKAQITEAYVIIKDGEAWLLGGHFNPLLSASTHVVPDPTRTRKLLLSRREIDLLRGKVERAGYTIVPLDLHWSHGRAKLNIGLAKGKKLHDKRGTEKERDWQREKGRAMRHDA